MSKKRTAKPNVEALECRNLMAGANFGPVTLAAVNWPTDPPVLTRPARGTPGQFIGPLQYPPDSPFSPPPAPEVPPAQNPVSHPPFVRDPFANWGQGNINVTLVDGALRIRGDAGTNWFTLKGADGAYTIEPGATLVNGQYIGYETVGTSFVKYEGVTAIDIDLGDGNDNFRINATQLPSLTIRTGGGNDQISIEGPMPVRYYHLGGVIASDSPPHVLPVSRSLSTVSLPDYVQSAEPIEVDGNIFIDTGAGDDTLSIFVHATGNARVLMGAGDDSFIETPYELNPLTVVIGKLTAAGQRLVDLGAGQDVDVIWDEWWYDPQLQMGTSSVVHYLDFYQGMIDRGEATPGVAQIIRPSLGDSPAWIDAEGRLDVEFSFTRGFGRVIERLQARGVTIDAYSLQRGTARASIGLDDLKLFSNLPGLTGQFTVRNYLLYPPPGWLGRLDSWDYVRPGSPAAAEVERWQYFPNDPPPVDDMPPLTLEPLVDWIHRGKLAGPEPLG